MKHLAVVAGLLWLGVASGVAAREHGVAPELSPSGAVAGPIPDLGGTRFASTFKSSSMRRGIGSDRCAESVGLIETETGRSTGFLVADHPQLVLSTAHGLFVKGADHPLRRVKVRFDYARGGRISIGATIASVGATRDFATTNASRDWAILVLDRPLPEVAGLHLRDLAQPDEHGAAVSLLAYHYDFMEGNAAAVSDRCFVTDTADGLALHNCDAMVGSSGGPIVTREGGGCAAVAINQGALGHHRRNLDYSTRGSDATANRAIPLTNLQDALERLGVRLERGNAPASTSIPN